MSKLAPVSLGIAWTPDTKCTHTYIVFAQSFQASKHTHLFNLLLLLPAAWKYLYRLVAFFLRQYDSTIILFCVKIKYSA